MSWIFSDVDFVLDTPLLAKVSTGDPNAIESAAFIPGSMIRGSVAGALLAKGVKAESDAFYQIILSGSVRFLNAYPVISGDRSMPVPHSWKIAKGATLPELTKVLDFTLDDAKIQGKSINPAFSFAAGKENEWRGTQSGRTIRTHIARDRNRGKAWTETEGQEEISHGALFSYESLSAQQIFRGTIQLRSDDAALLETLVPQLSGSLTMGRSRRGGYGLVHCSMRAHDQQNPRVSEWVGNAMYADIVAGQSFRVVCASDCIVRNQSTGQLDPGAFPDMILDAFAQDVDFLPNRSFCGIGFAGGYNAKWGLPLQQSQTVSAGSVVVLNARRTIRQQELSSLETNGIGERLTEGFGRLIVQPMPTGQPILNEVSVDQPVHMPDGDPPPLVLSIEARILKCKLDSEIEAIAAQEAANPRNLPPNSLIGRLRFPLRRTEGGLNVLRDWLGEGENKLRATAMKSLERCRVGIPELSLRAWLLHRVDPSDQLLTIAVQTIACKFSFVDEGRALTLLNQYREESTLLLIDTVLAFLAKLGEPDGTGSRLTRLR